MGLRQYVSQFRSKEPLPEFDFQRKRVQQQLNQDSQLKRDALQRRLAQLQGGPSGAGIKMEQQLEDDLARRREEAEEGLFAAEIGVRRQMDEADKQRDFQRDLQRELTDKDLGFKTKLFDFDKSTKLRQLDLVEKEFEADQRTTEFNKITSILAQPNHQNVASGLKEMFLNQYTSPAAKAAAVQYMRGLGLGDDFMKYEGPRR